MQEPIVSYQQASDLKELGFDQKVIHYYDILDQMLYLSYNDNQGASNYNVKETLISAPSVSIALEWLREEMSIHCGAYPDTDGKSFKLGYRWRYYASKGDDEAPAIESSPLNLYKEHKFAESDMLSDILEYITDHKAGE